MSQREDFEAWATTQHIDVTRDGFGGYMSHWTEGALEGWQAALAQKEDCGCADQRDCSGKCCQKEAQQEPFKPLSDEQVLWIAESHGIDVYACSVLGFYADLLSTTPVQAAQQEPVTPEDTVSNRRVIASNPGATISIMQNKQRHIDRQRAVLKQALEALDDTRYVSKYSHIKDAIAAIRAELGEMK